MRGGWILWFFLLGAYPGGAELWAQLRIEIRQVPDYTPAGDTLYLAGSLYGWPAADPRLRFSRTSADRWVLQLPMPTEPLDFKITRGSWDRVEGGPVGERRYDRRYLPRGRRDTLRLRVLSWEDMRDSIQPPRMVSIRLVSTPDRTPVDARIYVSGNFNGWAPADQRYRLRPDSLAGGWRTAVPLFGDTLIYKFTRGSWASAEGRSNGLARPNRVHVFPPELDAPTLTVRVASWEDLYGSPYNGYTLFLLLAALQGLLLIVAMHTLQNNNRVANRILSVLLFLLILAFLARVAVYDRDIFQRFPKLILLPDFIYFLYGPLFLAYMRALLLPPERRRLVAWPWLVPFALQALAYSPLVLMDSFAFTHGVIDLRFRPLFIATAGAALIYNAFCWWRGYRLVRRFESEQEQLYSFEQNLRFLKAATGLHGLALAVWLVTFLIGGYGWLAGLELTFLTDKLTDGIWLLIAITLYYLGYYAMRQPAIFQLATADPEAAADPESTPDKDDSLPAELEEWTERLRRYMEDERPYLDPQLNLATLAEAVRLSPHELSRTINAGFDQNFFDFVNSYRVTAFQERVLDPAYRNQTFLAIALAVGFNSKTAFNRAFKKHTDLTPRQYVEAQGNE